MSKHPIHALPGQVIGLRPARRHERPGLYPVYAIAGGSAPLGDPGPAPDPAPQPDPQPPAPPVPPAPQKVEDLPDWAQKIITDTRKEAGDNRVARTAAENKAQAILDAIAKATGQAPEADPEKLTADLTTAQQAAVTAARELAVYKAAANIADPVKLLDRTSFTTAIAGIDPSDGPALKAAIEAAVAADNTLKAVQAAPASGAEFTGGSGEGGARPKSIREALTRNS